MWFFRLRRLRNPLLISTAGRYVGNRTIKILLRNKSPDKKIYFEPNLAYDITINMSTTYTFYGG